MLALLDKYAKLPEEIVKIFVAEIAIALGMYYNYFFYLFTSYEISLQRYLITNRAG